MKTTIFLSACLWLSYDTGYSQTNVYHPFPDSAAIWNFVDYYAFGSASEKYSMVISGDTLVNGQPYHKLMIPYVLSIKGSGGGLQTAGYKGAVRQDTTNRKVFFIPPTDSTEQLLYDFAMQVGDTLKGYIAPDIMPDVVQSIDSVLVGTNYRKRWKINLSYQVYLIEGIGSTYGLIEKSPGLVTDMPHYSLICFGQNGQILFPDTATNCQLITSVNSIDTKSNEINIIPNPFSTQTVLQTGYLFKNATLMVDNCYGQTVKQITPISNGAGEAIILHRGNLPSGLYFLRLAEDNKIFTDKLIITDN